MMEGRGDRLDRRQSGGERLREVEILGQSHVDGGHGRE